MLQQAVPSLLDDRLGESKDTEGGMERGVCGLRGTGKGIEGKMERGEDRRTARCASCLETPPTHMLLTNRGERGEECGGGGRWRGSGRREQRKNCSAACLRLCPATVSLLQWQTWVLGKDNRASVTQRQRLEATHQCLADETRLAWGKEIV